MPGLVFDRVKQAVTNTGTTALVLGAAEQGVRTFKAAGAVTGNVLEYVVEQGTEWEYGEGTYTDDGVNPPSLTRTVRGSSAGGTTPITLNGNARVLSTSTKAYLENKVSLDGEQIITGKKTFRAEIHGEGNALKRFHSARDTGAAGGGGGPLQILSPVVAAGQAQPGAMLTFHREQAYAVNLGLDSDNLLRLGGFSGIANAFSIDPATGKLAANGSLTSRGGANNVQTDSALPVLRFGFNGTEDYRHHIVTRHNSSLANNAIDIYLHKGGTDLIGANPTHKALTIDTDGINVTGTIKKNGVEIGGSADPLVLATENSGSPAKPATGIILHAAKRAGKAVPGWIDRDGRRRRAGVALGTFVAYQQYVSPGASNGVNIHMGGYGSVGAEAHPPLDITFPLGKLPRVYMATGATATANTQATFKGGGHLTSRNVGYHATFLCGFTAITPTQRAFIGFTEFNNDINFANGATSEISAMTSMIGLAKDSGDTALSLMHNDTDTTTPATKIALPNTGALTANSLYMIEISCRGGGDRYFYRITKWDAAGVETVDEGETGTLNLMRAANQICHHLWVNNAGTTANIGVSYTSMVIELDI